MAAILEPRRIPPFEPERPALRLVSSHDGRPVGLPVELGLSPLHLAGAVAALVFAMLLALAIGNGALAGLAPAGPASPRAAAASSAEPGAQHVTVRAGDSLWSIARRLQPTGDLRPLVDQLVAANGAGPLQPGQQLVVPR